MPVRANGSSVRRCEYQPPRTRLGPINTRSAPPSATSRRGESMDDRILRSDLSLDHRPRLIPCRRKDADRAGAQVRPSRRLERWLLHDAVHLRLGAEPMDRRAARRADRKEIRRNVEIYRRIFGSRAKRGAFQRLAGLDDSGLGTVEIFERSRPGRPVGCRSGSVKWLDAEVDARLRFIRR